MSIQVILQIFSFIFGSLIGSFLNVVVYRMPRELSVVKPRSSCPECGHLIKWYENLPIISYIILKGKCSKCGCKISIRYPLLELLMGVIALLLAPRDVVSSELFHFGFYFSIAAIFVSHFLIDVEHQLLPDKINLYFLAITIPYVLVNYSIYYWLIGGMIGFLGPLAITYIFYKIKGQIGLGGGDIKLFGILGLLLGPIGILNNIFLSCMLGSVLGIILILLKKMDRNSPFAFGPFILIAASIQIFFPDILKYISPIYIK